MNEVTITFSTLCLNGEFTPVPRTFFYAAVDGDVVGMVSVQQMPLAGVGWINDLKVKPEFARKGIGSALVRLCVGLIESWGGDYTPACGVHSLNIASRRVFEKMGFTVGHLGEYMPGVLYYERQSDSDGVAEMSDKEGSGDGC